LGSNGTAVINASFNRNTSGLTLGSGTFHQQYLRCRVHCGSDATHVPQLHRAHTDLLERLVMRRDAEISRKVVAIKVHHLVPGRDKVTHERLLRIAARIDLRDGSEL